MNNLIDQFYANQCDQIWQNLTKWQTILRFFESLLESLLQILCNWAHFDTSSSVILIFVLFWKPISGGGQSNKQFTIVNY